MDTMAITGRPKAELVVSAAERAALVRLANRIRVNRSLAIRAKIVLACAKEQTNSAVARQLRTSNQTVGKWRRRFVEQRLDGLYDEPRVGAPRKFSDEAVEAVVVKTLETTPKGRTHWSTRKMAEKAGMSHATVGHIWRTFGLRPHRSTAFKMSPDPQLVEKIRDGLASPAEMLEGVRLAHEALLQMNAEEQRKRVNPFELPKFNFAPPDGGDMAN